MMPNVLDRPFFGMGSAAMSKDKNDKQPKFARIDFYETTTAILNECEALFQDAFQHSFWMGFGFEGKLGMFDMDHLDPLGRANCTLTLTNWRHEDDADRDVYGTLTVRVWFEQNQAVVRPAYRQHIRMGWAILEDEPALFESNSSYLPDLPKLARRPDASLQKESVPCEHFLSGCEGLKNPVLPGY